MAKRYYICNRVGDGTSDNAFTPDLMLYLYQNHPVTTPNGGKKVPKPLIRISSNNCTICLLKYDLSQVVHDDVMANMTDITTFGTHALTQTIDNIPAAKRLEIKTRLETEGFDFDWVVPATHTVKDVLKYVARTIQLAGITSFDTTILIANKNFDINKTVGTLSNAKKTFLTQRINNMGVDTSWITNQTLLSKVADRIYQDTGKYMYEDND